MLLAVCGGRGAAQLAPKGAGNMAFQVSTTAFPEQGNIPKKHTCDGEDVSPALSWRDLPAGTQALALIADDPDAPVGTFTHWVLYDLSPSARELAEGLPKKPELPDGARQGQNDFRRVGYNGPCPPPGKPHRYYFKVYALGVKLGLKAGASRKDVERAMQGHVLGQAQTWGKYGR